MNRLYYLIIVLLTLISCDHNTVFDQYNSVNKLGWHKDSVQVFSLPVMDTLKSHHIYFNLRNTNLYPYSNLFLISTLDYPNGKKQIDTLEYQMAMPNGEWLGVGGSVKENKLWFQESFKFKEKGNYQISVSQAMRSNGSENGVLYLKGITNIGLQIEVEETP